MTSIKFGTDGWRAIIAKDYTVQNVARVAYATAEWLLTINSAPTCVVGHDCRFGGPLFLETVIQILTSKGVKVIIQDDPFVSTPMVSLATFKTKSDAGIILTASHNPPTYNGFKIKAGFGGPALPSMIDAVEAFIPKADVEIPEVSHETLFQKGLLLKMSFEDLYVSEIEGNFDLETIRNSSFKLAYDAMYGAGQRVVKRILPETVQLHCTHNPGFDGTPPEPIMKNLHELSNLLKGSNDLHLGLATDGDADRIGLFDDEGNFVDSHHILLLLVQYLVSHKKMSGKVVVSFSVTPRMARMCKHFGLDHEVTKIGFKYICETMTKEDVLVGGEESGGIAVKGFIPERDGIWIGLVLLEYMAKSGKSLRQLINEVYEITGSFAFERYDLHITEAQKTEVLNRCKNDPYSEFGQYKVTGMETIDGFKYLLGDDDWVMLRASGTEPVLRVYAESSTQKGAFDILDTVKASILG